MRRVATTCRSFGFWLTLLAGVVITVVCFGLFALTVRRFGIELL